MSASITTTEDSSASTTAVSSTPLDNSTTSLKVSTLASTTESGSVEENPPKQLSVAEKIAAMKAKSATEQQNKEAAATKSTAVNTTPATNINTPTTEDSNVGEVVPKKMSVAEKIAAMKAKSAASEQQKNNPPPPKKSVEPLESGDDSPKPKRLSVADKIAAMKARSEAESKVPPPALSPSPGSSDRRKSVSMADKIAKLQQKGAEAANSIPLDSPTRPKSATVSGSPFGSFSNDDDENDDVHDRPLSVPRKLNPNLMARASMAMPMMMPGMTHPGLSKRGSTGNIFGGGGGGGSGTFQRSSSIGSIRVTNEGSEAGEITHVSIV